MENNAYRQYKEQSISTMTPNELLLLVYDELVKRLTHCDLALSKEDYVLFEASVDRSVEILQYLDDTLDRQYPVSENLHRLYEFFCFELSRVKAGRRREELQKIRPMIADLRSSFQKADKNCAEGAVAEA